MLRGRAADYARLTLLATVARAAGMGLDLSLQWANDALSLFWQERLTTHIMAAYADRNAFYAVRRDGQITDADTRITREVIDNCHRCGLVLRRSSRTAVGWQLECGVLTCRPLLHRMASLLKGGGRGGGGGGGGGGGRGAQSMGSGGGRTQPLFRPIFDALYCSALLLQVQLPWTAMIALWGYGLLGLGMVQLLSPDFSRFAAMVESANGAMRCLRM